MSPASRPGQGPPPPATTAPDQLVSARDGRRYWQGVSADVDGMLGGVPSMPGFGSISRIDLQGSRTFLARLGIGLKGGRRPISTVLEGGAGIGRVTEGLLLPLAEHVDIVEPMSKFTDVLQGKSGVRTVFNVGLEDWLPPPGVEYDLVWTQWCLGYLSDDHLVRFLRLCKTVLRPESGVIVVKENLNTSGTDLFDATDSSVLREDQSLRDIFQNAGLELVKTELQRGFPEMSTKRLYPVRMYALKPC
ncbi:adoMet dependent proline di-methyltransferase [Hirsutella rhossiliensis]|uniref:Alpha N-terminal protein methyltransferase 1 n=1 Tax=Hirsutella rhossiliensis TaxID=111463 RepID=A0A9P8N6F2_9HYPO|nr:adoMet dependent proline di-methyltransferase domain-containing protein [Hirsutella rhossiliensis]KAH0967832.1 adoMet dependent proline di-methyltransferase domain-containing protein [Hirsutella rhossiliensis]